MHRILAHHVFGHYSSNIWYDDPALTFVRLADWICGSIVTIDGGWMTANCCWPVTGLSVLSILFDVFFMVQHYVLYPASHRRRRVDGAAKSSASARGLDCGEGSKLSDVLLED